MNADPATADYSREHHERALIARDPGRGRLLGLVRTLMDFGRDLLTTLQARNAPAAPPDTVRQFGSLSLTLIIARITRGLMIAAALERRLLHPRPRAVGRDEPAASASPRARRAPGPPKPDEADELDGVLPTAREIAARIRNRKTGAVIVDICRDLGIDAEHPLWRAIEDAITAYGGSMVKMMRVWHRRSAWIIHLAMPPGPNPRFAGVVAALKLPP